MRQALAAYPRPQGAADDAQAFRDARLRDDRAALASMLAKEPTNASWYLLIRAQAVGVEEDSRVQAWIARAKVDETNAHAKLPAALRKAGLSMWPPPEGTSPAAH
jgi:hypothetical protein